MGAPKAVDSMTPAGPSRPPLPLVRARILTVLDGATESSLQ